MFIFLIAYRARGDQTFRRNQLFLFIENVNIYFNINNIKYKIMICEQNDDEKFNRGKLLNIAYLISEKIFLFSKKYFHMNIDYLFNLTYSFPQEILNFNDGFLHLYKPPFPVLGGACVFDTISYKIINGFPNDLIGWGGDDWAIYNRIIKINLPLVDCEKVGFIIENNEDKKVTDTTNNDKNMELAKRDDLNTNGLSSCIYKINNKGEFHNENYIYHYLVDL